MASHFACIGLQIETQEAFQAFVSAALDRADWTEQPDGCRHALWTDASGALLAANLDRDGSVVCATPSFAGASRIAVKVLGIRADPACTFCDLLHVEVLEADGTMAYPLALQIDDLGVSRERIVVGEPAALRIAAFAEDVAVWQNDDAYFASQGDGIKMAPESLIPSGLFGEQPHARVVLTGHVQTAERRLNELSGMPFWWLAVQTYSGIYDVVIAASDLATAPERGAVVKGSFWVVGRLIA